METVTVSEILDLVKSISKNAQTAIHFLEGRILIGEINHPAFSPPKIIRKRRTKKEITLDERGKIFTALTEPSEATPHIKMDLEKEYQAGRTSPILSEANKIDNLPEDKDPFFAKVKKVKKERKKREKKESVAE